MTIYKNPTASESNMCCSKYNNTIRDVSCSEVSSKSLSNNEKFDAFSWFLSPRPGINYFIYNKRIVKAEVSTDNSTRGVIEKIILSFFFTKKEVVLTLLDSLADNYNKSSLSDVKPKRYNSDLDELSLPIKREEAVILNKDLKESLFGDVDKFLNNYSFYYDRGLPYKRGYLFYGKPGTGKTSITVALANKFGLNLIDACLNELSDVTFKRLVNRCPAKSIILIEDADYYPCLGKRNFSTDYSKDVDIDKLHHLKSNKDKLDKEDVERVDSNSKDEFNLRVSSKCFLNILDGINSPDKGIIFILTTNHIESIDPAVLRYGRIDFKADFNDLQPEAALRMCKLFNSDFNKTFNKEINPAYLQNLLIQYPELTELYNVLKDYIN